MGLVMPCHKPLEETCGDKNRHQANHHFYSIFSPFQQGMTQRIGTWKKNTVAHSDAVTSGNHDSLYFKGTMDPDSKK